MTWVEFIDYASMTAGIIVFVVMVGAIALGET